MPVRWLPSQSMTWVDDSLKGSDHRNRALLSRILSQDTDVAAWEGLRNDYESQSSTWRFWTQTQLHYLVPLVEALHYRPVGEQVLEVGAGTGEASEVVARRAGRFVASDISEGMIREHVHKLSRLVADVRALPFADGAFDTIVGLNCVPGYVEFNRVLSESGALLLVESFADHTPLHVPPEVTSASLGAGWEVTAAKAGAGQWVWATRA